MKVFGLVGDPVRHSLSPAMHAAAFRELGVDAEYRLVRVPADRPAEVRSTLRALARSGGGNVTTPHKQTAAAALDTASGDVQLTGACNCFWSDEEGELRGDNTDVGGILAVLQSLQDFQPSGSSVLVLGAGGAARAAVVAAARAGAGHISIHNRTPDHATAVVERLARGIRASIAVAPAPIEPGAYDLVIQATRLGLDPADPLPIEFRASPPAHVLDLVYTPGETRWTRYASERGARAVDGLAVLLEQGALSLERWLGRPLPLAVRNVMWESIQRALR